MAPIILNAIMKRSLARAALAVRVTNTRKRQAGREYVTDKTYSTTTVKNFATPAKLAALEVTVDRPAPGTPPDTLYTYPTAPDAMHPYVLTASPAR